MKAILLTSTYRRHVYVANVLFTLQRGGLQKVGFVSGEGPSGEAPAAAAPP